MVNLPINMCARIMSFISDMKFNKKSSTIAIMKSLYLFNIIM